LFLGALIAAILNAFVTIADHYDTRDNEKKYKKLAYIIAAISVALIILSFGYEFGQSIEPAVVI
jgi:glycerol uptake facilitator-like aquaporin